MFFVDWLRIVRHWAGKTTRKSRRNRRQRHERHQSTSHLLLERLEDRFAPATGVHDVTTGLSYATIQAAVNVAGTGDTINVDAGSYNEDVNVNKSITLHGAGYASTTVSGPIGGSGSTFTVSANNVEISGFTITRDGNNMADWNNANLNTAGISVISGWTGMLVHDNLITQMRTGIDVNNSSGETIRNNVITDNRTGLIFRNVTNNLTVVENEITNNWTDGVLFLDQSGGTNSPLQTALNCTFSNNNISGNWYGGIVDRQTGGVLPAPGTTNLKNFSGNWFGTAAPVITTANSAEPLYPDQIPVEFGGSAVNLGGAPDIAGPASANFDITPYLGSGTDTNVQTTLGRGTFGFQGDFSQLTVTSQLAQTGATSRIQEAIGLVTSGGTVSVAAGTYLESNISVSESMTIQARVVPVSSSHLPSPTSMTTARSAARLTTPL